MQEEDEEEELRLPDEGGEDGADAGCLRYSLGEEVEALDPLPDTPSSEVEM